MTELKISQDCRQDITEASDDDVSHTKRIKKRVQHFSDSDVESDKENTQDENNKSKNENVDSSESSVQADSDVESKNFKSSKKSRFKSIFENSDETDSDLYNITESSTSRSAVKNEGQQIGMKNKRNKLKHKFKSLVTSRENTTKELPEAVSSCMKTTEIDKDDNFDNSIKDETSIESIKQKLKEKTYFNPTLCDPDTSDEDSHAHHKEIFKKKKQRKSNPQSPKPIRMSAKEAVENMQKIKSESNRMLREKEISLPYHRPKALSLKDVMSRRKPVVTSDGKTLPIKMNEEQLKQYALLLEQRQKEIVELCKSDTDEEILENKDHLEDASSTNKTLDNTNCNIDDTDKTKVHDLNQSKSSPDCSNIEKESEYNAIKNIDVNFDNSANTADGMLKNTNENDNIHIGRNLCLQNDNNNSSKLTVEDSQLISLQYYSERLANNNEDVEYLITTESNSNNSLGDELMSKTKDDLLTNYNKNEKKLEETLCANNNDNKNIEQLEARERNKEHNEFSDDDMENIDSIIENFEIVENLSGFKDNSIQSIAIKDPQILNKKPKLTGAPGAVIDLDDNDNDSVTPKKLTGVELLKERFTYFAKLKTPDEIEREKERKSKPGTQHLKLKQELENKIAEQRSLEWAKRLEEENQQQLEMNAIRGDASEEEDDIEKIEAKLEENDELLIEKAVTSDSENEEEEDNDDLYFEEEKPKKRNPMIADEAEESDGDIDGDQTEYDTNSIKNINNKCNGVEDLDDDVESEEESSDENESSESEEDNNLPKKRGRILKAFEDSDDETVKLDDEITLLTNNSSKANENKSNKTIEAQIINDNSTAKENGKHVLNSDHDENCEIGDSQDDELHLAQMHKSLSEDLFTSQESALIAANSNQKLQENEIDSTTREDENLSSQIFLIQLNHSNPNQENVAVDLNCSAKLPTVCETQFSNDTNMYATLDMTSGNFSRNLESQLPLSNPSQSQEIGEDILALCTGKFYDNEFVSQTDKDNINTDISQPNASNNSLVNVESIKESEDSNVLKTILDELDEPEFDLPKPNKFFVSCDKPSGSDKRNITSSQPKKFVIKSDDEEVDKVDVTENKRKKLKKKIQKRALQISDDEEDLEQEEIEEPIMSDFESDNEKIFEYDSEENEVEVTLEKNKKKRKLGEFFEQEAELTSEDEWAGSGDEDEAGLDRMEREAGDDDVFHQGRLQRELGQIHMRDVLDQDKREVRLIQELLFEDGDLGAGHRQRKFRWRNADGEEEIGTIPDGFADTQEEEFESEEQWRKQRHEREVFLRKMQQQDEANEPNTTLNRTTIIKANLCSKSMSSLLLEVNQTKVEQVETVVNEKKTAKDIPSPKKPFSIFQNNYHGSLLSRGRNVLSRLAALATPLVGDNEDAPSVTSLAISRKGNFVFAAITPEDDEVKTTKRKADTKVDTPRLIKKMKTDAKQKFTKSSLLDHLKP